MCGFFNLPVTAIALQLPLQSKNVLIRLIAVDADVSVNGRL